jgi:hypothetical protein
LVEDSVLKDVSYTSIMLEADGLGTPIQKPALEPDVAVIENLILSIASEKSAPVVHVAIQERLHQMSMEDLVKARDYFRDTCNDAEQYLKYNRAIDRR